MAYSYKNVTVDANGNIVPGAAVEVRDRVGALATIYSATGGALTNPFTSDAAGEFEFYAIAGTYFVTTGTSPSDFEETVVLGFGNDFPSVSSLTSDLSMRYAPSADYQTPVIEGETMSAGGYIYQVVGSGDAADITTAGGVKVVEVDNVSRFDNVEFRRGRVSGYATLKNTASGGQARLYVEPNDGASGDVVAAIKVFGDEYTDALGAHNRYRDVGIYIDKTEGSYPNIGMAVMNAKNGGEFWGLFMEMGLSVSDGGAIPVKAGRINHSAASDYFSAKLWIPGQAVTSGENVLVGTDAASAVKGRIYVATSTGNMGSTKPTHAAGSGSDGVITYDFVEDLSDTSSGFRGYAIIGDKADTPIRGAHILDNDIVGQFTQPAIFKNQVELFFGGASDTSVSAKTYTDFSGDLVVEALEAGKSVFIQAHDGAQFRVTDSLVEVVGAAIKYETATQTGATTLDFLASNIAVVNNLSALTIDDVSGRSGQPVWIQNGNNTNTTLENNANIVTGTGANYTMSAAEIVHGLMTTSGKVVLIGLS